VPDRKTLDTQHPFYDFMKPRWARYRAFGEGIDTDAQKRPWLPIADGESETSYARRLALSHDLGSSPAAITRVKGALLRGAVAREYADTHREAFTQFDAQAGGVGVSIEKVLEAGQEEAAMMGLCLYFVGRAATPGAANAAAEATPFVEQWTAEEAVDWGVDAQSGALDWIILKRTVSERAGPNAARAEVTRWIVADRSTTTRYRAESEAVEPLLEGAPDVHNLGVVPVVAHYGRRFGTMQGASYVDALSRADLRRLQLESNRAQSAYLHANPKLAISSRRTWDQIFGNPSRVMILDPADGEKAEYITLDSAGMTLVGEMIAEGDRRGPQLAGMDSSTFAPADSGGKGVRSGAALQWAFSTSEGPTLESLYEGLCDADLGIHEVVARYFDPRLNVSPTERVFDGTIRREKQWDFMELADLIEILSTNVVRSETWRKEVEKQIATRAPGNLDPETATVIAKEIDAAKPAEADPAGGADGNPDAAADAGGQRAA